ncbi:hypothetical protein IT570_03370 [Candidatus Sumerlaeota bacterium]|nr:hypothetical protein [Candidatus Sumerlaeota bacterium]
MTPDQEKFLRDLLKDVSRLFLAQGGKTDADLVAWMGGLLNRHIMSARPQFWNAWSEIEASIFALNSAKARRLIGSLLEVRTRLDGKGSRDQVSTPKHLLRSIWTTVRQQAISEEDLRKAVRKLTNGETDSTKHLRQAEATDLARQLGVPVKVHKFQQTKTGVKLGN